jgi:hypothetical protein
MVVSFILRIWTERLAAYAHADARPPPEKSIANMNKDSTLFALARLYCSTLFREHYN